MFGIECGVEGVGKLVRVGMSEHDHKRETGELGGEMGAAAGERNLSVGEQGKVFGDSGGHWFEVDFEWRE